MNRQEVIIVLREVIKTCGDVIDLNYILLNPSAAQIRKNARDYELLIKCIPTDLLRRCFAPILEKHKLRMKESKDSVIIYTPD